MRHFFILKDVPIAYFIGNNLFCKIIQHLNKDYNNEPTFRSFE